MQFLKTLIWILIAGLGIAFALNNWVPVTVSLWGNLVADVNLPTLVTFAFLLGFVPMMLVYQASRWRMRQRLAALERSLNELRSIHAAPAPAPAPVPASPLDGDGTPA